MPLPSNKFGYDAQGRPAYLEMGVRKFYYVCNIQGDVIGILNGSSQLVVSYSYDAWGNVLSIGGSMANTLGQLNPLRYRGYVYDQETKLYYLQSRYYNPEMGRFINADAYVATGQGCLGNNMFAYCRNNPVCRKDVSGMVDADCVDLDDDDLEPFDDIGRNGGGGNGPVNQSTIGTNTSVAPGGSTYNFNGAKSFAYAEKRGWSSSMIKTAIQNGSTGESINRANGNLCTVYNYPNIADQYVVLENISRCIVQVSDFNDPNWILDRDIRLYRK